MKSRNIKMLKDSYPHKRDAYKGIENFIKNRENNRYNDKVLLIFGLQHSGKTTMIEQFIANQNEEDKKKTAYFIIDNGDTMDDIEEAIETAQNKGIKTIIFDEITKVDGLSDSCSSLANVYAKEGMNIILSGTDSLGLFLASGSDLEGKSITLNMTHIPLAEYCRVLEKNDVDDYIRYGGLMCDGNPDNYYVDDYESSKKFLKDSVAANIANSLKKSPKTNCLEILPKDELAVIIEKIVEKYSGQFDEKIMQQQLKKSSLTVLNEKPLPQIGEALELDEGYIHMMSREKSKKEIANDFLPQINASMEIKTQIDETMVNWLKKYMTDMGVLSTIKKHLYTKDLNGVWSERVEENSYHIVQPAIKFQHLEKAKEFIKTSDWYKPLDNLMKEFLNQKLSEYIMGQMLEEIILFDTTCYLAPIKEKDMAGTSYQRYEVCKPEFRILSDEKPQKEYDMLIKDNKENKCYAFEIKHSNEAVKDQCQHLLNNEIRELVENEYNTLDNLSVLYRGDPFISGEGVIYLNVVDFMKTLEKEKDISKTMEILSSELEIKEIPYGEKHNDYLIYKENKLNNVIKDQGNQNLNAFSNEIDMTDEFER